MLKLAKISKSFICAFFFTILFVNFAQASAGTETKEERFNATKMIMHHIGDDHKWHLATIGEHHINLPLPIILWTNSGLVVFSSNSFDHHNNNEVNGFKLEHNHITALDGSKVLDFSITKNIASTLFATILLFLVIFSVKAGYVKNKGRAPKGIQSFFEPVILYIRDEVAIPNMGHNYIKYMPFLLSIFFFILFNNLLGLIPGGANASGNIGFTMVLAVIVALVTNFSGKSAYWKHILMPPGVPILMYIIIVPIEIIGIFTKPFALMIRLFANITAGHIIILSLFSFIFVFESFAVGIPAATFAILMTFMELFVACLQAFIFTMLTGLFIGSAIEEHHHEESHH